MRRTLPLLALVCSAPLFAQEAGDALFDTDQVIEIRFTFADDDHWVQLMLNHNAGEEADIPADVTITDQEGTWTFDSVAVRLKGNSSYDFYPTQKKPIKVDFDGFVDDQEYHGLKKLNLNNSWSDPAFLREKVFFDVCRREGVLAPRVVFANVYLNDVHWGFYNVVEQVDKTFLQRWLGDNDGNLFKAGDNYSPDGGGVGQEADLNYYGPNASSYTGRYELKTNGTQNDWTDLIELLRLVDNAPIAELVTELPERTEFTALLRSLALDNLYGSMDAYYGSARNYYLYHDSTTLKWNWVHWDANMSFGRYIPQWVDDVAALPATYYSPGRRLLQRIMTNPTLRQAYLLEYCDLFDRFTNAEMDPRIDALADLVRPHVLADNNMEYQDFYFDENINVTVSAQSGGFWSTIPGLKSFIAERRTNLAGSLDCAAVGLEEFGVEAVLQVVPNPTQGRVQVGLPDGLTPQRVLLVDPAGRSLPVDLFQGTLDLTDLPAGIYVLTIEVDGAVFRERIVKE